MNQVGRLIGISLGCFLPWITEPLRAISWAGELGFDFVQTLPFKGFGPVNDEFNKRLTELPIPIRYCEGAWNDWDSVRQVVTNHVTRRAGLPGHPTILDCLLFPPRHQCETLEHALSQAKDSNGALPYLISHSFPAPTQDRDEAARQLIEVHRGLGLSVDEIIERCNQRSQRRCLVLDTHHLRQMNEKRWGATLPRLLPYVRAIHVQPLRPSSRGERSELDRCLAGEPTVLDEMLEWINYASPEPPCDFIVEATIGPKGVIHPNKIAPTLRAFRNWVAATLSR